MDWIQLALHRAKASSLRAFQQKNQLRVTGTVDVPTMLALQPYFVGYRLVRVQQGDTYGKLAASSGTTTREILAANPGLDPNQLPVGQPVVVPMGWDVVPMDVPFSYEVLTACLEGLQARYPFLRRREIGQSVYGRKIYALELGTGRRRVLYNGAHHANEWITTSVLLKFLEQYCRAIVYEQTLFGFSARRLYRDAALHMVPMVNPDGVELVTRQLPETSEEFQRASMLAQNAPDIPFPDGWKANLNGVDLNLNYPAGWETARENKFALGCTQPGPRDYVGARALDQPEVAALAGYTMHVRPHLTLAYHTQGREIYWKYQDIEVPGAQELGALFSSVSGYALEETPYASGFAGYKDWFIQTYHKPGYTIEAGIGASPLPLSQLQTIYQNNLGILTIAMAE